MPETTPARPDAPPDAAPLIDPYDMTVQQCPAPVYAALRGTCPVYFSAPANLFLITRYDLIEQVLRDPVTFSNRSPRDEAPSTAIAEQIRDIRASGWEHVPTLATEDAPAHTVFRSIVTPFFSPARIKSLEANARRACADLVVTLADRDADFVTEFAEPLPTLITAAVMNLDTADLPRFRAWTKDATAAVGNYVPDQRRIEAERGIVEMQHYFAERLARARIAPGDDFFSALIRAEFPGDDGRPRPLTQHEMLSLSRQLFVGGIETTTKLLAEGVRLLAEQPGQYARLRDNPSEIPTHVEEMLRLSSPAQGIFRVATTDTELGGSTIPAGSRLVIMYAAANRDPEVFPNPDDYDPERTRLRRHLAFGKGNHFCLGAPLTRMEATVAFETLTARFRQLRLVPGRNEFTYQPSFILRGLQSLWVHFSTGGEPTDREQEPR
jgi:cytochrome P450